MDETDKEKLLPPEGQNDHLTSIADRMPRISTPTQSNWRDREVPRPEEQQVTGSMDLRDREKAEENKKIEEFKVPDGTAKSPKLAA